MSKISFKWPKELVLGVIIFCIGLVYFTYLPVRYDFDGTVFSQYLRYALIRDDLIVTAQPQHPLYIPINYLIYKGLETVSGYSMLEYFHLQLFSLCFGLLTLWVSYKIIKEVAAAPQAQKGVAPPAQKATLPADESRNGEKVGFFCKLFPGINKKVTDRQFFYFAGMVLIACCYGTWYYSVEAEVHMAGLFFITAGVYLLFFKPGPPDKLSRTLAASFCFALSACFHLTNGLIAISVLLIFILEKKSFGKIFKFFSFYLLFLLVGLSVFTLITKVNMLVLYKKVSSGKDLLAGYKISYWTGFSLETLWESIKSAAYGILVPASPVLAVLSIFLFFAAAALIIYAGAKSKEKKTYYRLGLWALPYFIFFTFWDYRNTEFKLNVILPFMILFIVSAAFIQIQNKISFFLFTAIIVSVFIVNLYFFVLPANNIQNNRNYLVAEAVGKVTLPRSIVVIGGCGTDLSIYNKIYISYFFRRKTFRMDWMLGKGLSLEDIDARIKQELSDGTAVYFFSEIVRESKTVRQILKNHNLKAVDYFKFIKKMDLKEKIPLINGYYLARI